MDEVSLMSGGSMVLEREAGPAASFESVFNTQHAYVYRVAHALLGNAQDAEDVTQEVFLRVYRALPSYDPTRASLTTWLTRIAVNACNTHRRRHFWQRLRQTSPAGQPAGTEYPNGEATPEPADPSLWGAPEDQALQNELRRTVRDVLAQLRPEHRTPLVLHYYLNLSCPEIARIMDCPEGTVYSRLHYARRLVQAQLAHRALRSYGEVV